MGQDSVQAHTVLASWVLAEISVGTMSVVFYVPRSIMESSQCVCKFFVVLLLFVCFVFQNNDALVGSGKAFETSNGGAGATCERN